MTHSESIIKRNYILGSIYFIIYIALTFTPLIVILADNPRETETSEVISSATLDVSEEESHQVTENNLQQMTFLVELSVALGFIGLATMLLQFLLTSRVRSFYSPFGIDIVYFFHHVISIISLFLILLHPVILIFVYDDGLSLLNLFKINWGIKLGILSVLFLIILVSVAKFRGKININYHIWRILHGLTAFGTLFFAITHIFLSGKYTDQPGSRIIWIAYSLLWVSFIIYVRIVKPLKKYLNPYEVVEVIKDFGDSFKLLIKAKNGSSLSFIPGQFGWLTAKNKPYTSDDHPFSFSSSSKDGSIIEFGIKELGDFTREIKHLNPGDTVYMDGPFGNFSIDVFQNSRGYVFFAGGIGISPLISMLRTLSDRKDKREITLFYASHKWDSLTYRDDLEALRDKLNITIIYVLETPDNDWEGEKGFITDKIIERHFPKWSIKDCPEVLICGPIPMMSVVTKLLRKKKFPQKHTHYERFDFM